MLTHLIGTSVSASWLILAVLLLRAVCKKIPRGMICLLWGLAALRLVCPFSIQSPLSLVPDVGPVAERIVSAAAPVSTPSTAPETGAVPSSPDPLEEEGKEPFSAPPDVRSYATAIWLAGMGLLLTYWVMGYLRVRRTVAASVRIKGNIWICDWIDTPFILGVIRPKIYLPSSMDNEQFSYVLAHEHAHLARQDHWWKPLGFAILTVYWFDPLVWAAYILFCRDMELACDERVARSMGRWERKRYAEILLRCSAAGSSPSVCPVSFGALGLKERIRAVLRYQKPEPWVLLTACAVGVLLAVCFLTDRPAAKSPAEAEVPAASPSVHRLVRTPPSPSPGPVTPEPSALPRPTKGQVLAARQEALAGMTQEQIDRLTSVITSQNQWWESEYLNNILTRLDDPEDLAWNYFDQTGDIAVGTSTVYSPPEGIKGDDILAVMDREGITWEEYCEKYGTVEPGIIGDCSKYSVEDIVSMVGELRDSVQNEDLRTDLAYLANQILWARETHRMIYVSNMFKLLHDMDYYLLRYGPADQPSTDPYSGMPSVVSNYYGMLTVLGADHGEGAAPVSAK